MVEYSIFGNEISFDDPALRFFNLQYYLWKAEKHASDCFDKWYTASKNIENILNGYELFATNTLQEVVIGPLFKQLCDCEIYDITRQQYENRCLNLAACYQSFHHIEEEYGNILSQQEREEYYRAERKAGRGRWSGGGFGLSGALKGAATAGALNAVSSLGHSIFNSIGNAGSAVAASASKVELYNNPVTKSVLNAGVNEAIVSAVNEHIQILNERFCNYVRSVFHPDKASALFENAKLLPTKRQELLTQAFAYCPWDHDLLKYIFTNYPSERKTIYAASQQFNVDLSGDVEDILAQQYTSTAKRSENEAQKVKRNILTIMEAFGVQESETLDRLEQDCITRICQGYGTADEATCNSMRERIVAYDALDKNKKPFLEKIKLRIEEIWAAEDGTIFDNLYLQTDLTSPESIAASVAYIKEKGRTSVSEKYLNALNACTEKNIRNARIYHQGRKPKLFKNLGIAVFVLAVLGFFTLGLPAALILGIVAIIFAVKASNLKSNWNTLTIDNTVIHPSLTIGAETETSSKDNNNTCQASVPQASKSTDGKAPSKAKKIIKTVFIAIIIIFACLITVGILSQPQDDSFKTSDTKQTGATDQQDQESVETDGLLAANGQDTYQNEYMSIDAPVDNHVDLLPADVPVGYEDIHLLYTEALLDRWDFDQLEQNGLNYMCAYSSDPSEIGYVYLDFDHNGVSELLVGRIGEYSGATGEFYDLYTLIDGLPVLIIASGERDMFYLCDDGFIGNEGSDSAQTYYFTYYGVSIYGELEVSESIIYDEAIDFENPWFYSIVDPSLGEYTSITESIADQMLQKHERACLEFLPFVPVDTAW